MRYLMLLLLFAACTSSQPVREAPDTSPERTGDLVIEIQNPIDLDNVLQRLPGVSVSGNRLLLRGREPLFVLDGVPLGRNYNSVRTSVVVNDVAEVRALTDPVDTNRYGLQGANGVILIKTAR